MSVQKRNDELVSLLSADFLRMYDWQSNPSQMAGALQMMHRAYDGSLGLGGALMYAWSADRIALDSYNGSQLMTLVNIGRDDFGQTTNGGPYMNLDGSTEALYIADAPWQETLTYTMFVWHWARTTTLDSIQNISSKYDVNGNNCSWRLSYDDTDGLRFGCNATGNMADNVWVNSSHAVAVNTWYFVGGYFNPSTLMRVFVGSATDASLTATSLTVGIPASLYDGTAPLAIGTAFNSSPTLLYPWSGLIGIGGARINVGVGTATSYPEINAYAARLFHMTRWFYQ